MKAQSPRTHTPLTFSLQAFTILELLTVVTIIVILFALTVQIAGFVQNKGARARAEAEIAAMSAALESYRADNGIYVEATGNPAVTAVKSGFNAGIYGTSSLALYIALAGDPDGNRTYTGKQKTYMDFTDNQLSFGGGNKVTAIADPFGRSYGYYSDPSGYDSNKAFNPTFDLWSTSGKTAATEIDIENWITNWR